MISFKDIRVDKVESIWILCIILSQFTGMHYWMLIYLKSRYNTKDFSFFSFFYKVWKKFNGNEQLIKALYPSTQHYFLLELNKAKVNWLCETCKNSGTVIIFVFGCLKGTPDAHSENRMKHTFVVFFFPAPR